MEKDTTNINVLPSPRYVQDNTSNTELLPPYTDEPPPYSSLAEGSSIRYFSTEALPDYMSKLPFGEQSSRTSCSPLTSPEAHNYSQQLIHTPRPSQQDAHYHTHSPTSDSFQVQQQSTMAQNSHSQQMVTQLSSTQSSPHKALLQPSSSRIVKTTDMGHRKTMSLVKDLENGKEYIVKEKTSRRGNCSKAVIVEVGGPKLYVKETPSKTVVVKKK